MKLFGLKRVYVFFTSILIFALHLPFVFAKTRSPFKIETVPALNSAVTKKVTVNSAEANIYDSLKLSSIGLARQVFDYAVNGLNYMKEVGKLSNDRIISIVDFSKPSSQKRLYVIDLKNFKILFNTYVAHGVNSGTAFANQFSNIPESNKSSLGFYQTSTTYIGKNGYSMRLHGLEKGINDKAYERDIVMHGAAYVSEGMIRTHGYIGRSFGCPAVAEKLHKPIIDKIKNGTCLFIYSPNKNYISQSKIIKHSSSEDWVYKN
ncbi:murein L,D-transpeptidase catalytic domain family protein [Ferruginibacter sp. SUN002]|uniref:murein L,D-transpeptidase catalytic domain family protein n=1 Tax=Ferruginibacter sp. SUN002 TaxID=2937789 RepID=UPI003D35C610